mgnify:CR=1 FL=1
MTESSPKQHTILIVEDNAEERDLAVILFESEGYKVLTASDALAGLETYRAHPEIDLVFTDVIMPGGVTGVEMAKYILEIKPGAPIILASGYQDKGAALVDSTYNMENVVYVDKPYDIDEIPGIVSTLLEKAESSDS